MIGISLALSLGNPVLAPPLREFILTFTDDDDVEYIVTFTDDDDVEYIATGVL